MVDVVDRATRSRMMSGIRGKDTKPEILIRKTLFARGFRYRLHGRKLPGSPDMVMPKYRTVIFVNGCFWHGHDCQLFKWPGTRKEFWRKKITGNCERDKHNMNDLLLDDWRVFVIWECAVKGKKRKSLENIVDRFTKWLSGNRKTGQVRG